MKRLSEYSDQVHITSVLRAMVIRSNITNKISIIGDDELAYQIIQSFWQSVNCEQPVRGDACGACTSCKIVENNTEWANLLVLWRLSKDAATAQENTLFYCFERKEGYLTFFIKKALGNYINSDILAAFVYSYQGTKQDSLNAAKKLAKNLLFDEFQQQYIEVLNNILYLKHNIEIQEVDKLEVLRILAARLSVPSLVACIRILWDASATTSLSDSTRIEIASLLISEALQPTVESTTWNNVSFGNEKPINTVEDIKLEQPLDLDKMLELAYA